MLSGLLVVDKAKHLTSHDVVEMVRKASATRRVGHFGTLDPMAEGILLIGIGKATKFFDFYKDKEKLYSGHIRFGFATTTFDGEGEPTTETRGIDLEHIDWRELEQRFTGDIMQTPPIFSAKKYKGKPLYKYARANQQIPISPVKVTIHSLHCKPVDATTVWFEARTSSGTYIRSLAHDLGVALGVGAHLQTLRRERIGEFDQSLSISSRELSETPTAGWLSEHIVPFEALLPEFPKIIIGPVGRRAILNGAPLEAKDILRIIPAPGTPEFRIFDEEGTFLALARKDERRRRFNPSMVFPPHPS